jgi:REP element-mobilizing transposase RayT
MWNDTDIPLGYLITFRSYGTWLHGDERGSTDRRRNIYRTPHIPVNERWKQHNSQVLKSDALTLDADQRQSVEKAVRETCLYRHWQLLALNARTNHVHVAVSIGTTIPSRALNAFKANATRQMREDRNWSNPHSPWADKGSVRHSWNERGVAAAIDYVVNGQGGDLPDFD